MNVYPISFYNGNKCNKCCRWLRHCQNKLGMFFCFFTPSHTQHAFLANMRRLPKFVWYEYFKRSTWHKKTNAKNIHCFLTMNSLCFQRVVFWVFHSITCSSHHLFLPLVPSITLSSTGPTRSVSRYIWQRTEYTTVCYIFHDQTSVIHGKE